MSEEIIDLKDVLERVQDDKELLAELFDIYEEDFLIKRKVLGEAIAAGDIAKIKEVAHSMKGSSGNISAKPLHAACLKLESLAKENPKIPSNILRAISNVKPSQMMDHELWDFKSF